MGQLRVDKIYVRFFWSKPMITIDASTATHRGGSFDPAFKLIRSSVNKNVLTGISVRRGAANVVPPDHLLLKILHQLGINRHDTLDEMYYKMRDRVYSISNALKLISATSYGVPQYDFIMDGCSELVLLHATDFEQTAWQNLRPIEFIYHEETNLNTMYGNSGRTDTVAFIAINVLMLAYQYKQWLNWRVRANSMDSSGAFLYKYPLTNAIYSYIDISLFNRILYEQQGWERKPDQPYRLRVLMNVEDQVAKHVQYVLNAYTKQTRTIAQYLYGTELIYKLSALELIPTVSSLKTRQCKWFFDLSKIPLILYGDTMVQQLNPKYNQGILTAMRRELGQSVDNTIWSRLPAAASSHIKEDMLVKINMF